MLSKKEFYESKIKEYGNIINSDPNNAKNYHYRALAKIELTELLKNEHTELPIVESQEYDSAIEDIDKAIELEPRYYHQMWNYHLRARAKIGLKKYDSAIVDLDKALRLHPDEHGLMWNHHLRARAYYESDNSEKALADINKAVSIDPLNYENYKLKKVISDKKS